MSTVIGLVGAKGAGKTTAYKIIQTAYADAAEITLAAKLKNVCAEVFGIPRDHFDSHAFKEKELETPVYLEPDLIKALFAGYDLLEGNESKVRSHIGKMLHTPRQIAQYVGTEVLRAVSPDIHCLAAVKAAKMGENTIGVVTDLRFPNEFSFFQKTATEFIPIYIKNTKAEAHAAGDAHVSEAYLYELAKSSTQVNNESTIEIFQTNLLTTLKNLGVLK